MPICFTKRFIFFHIPRCAGTSIERYFGFRAGHQLHGVVHREGSALTLHHLPYGEIAARDLVAPHVLESFFKFTVIRDPFRRMVSDFCWQKAHDLHGEFRGLDFQGYLDKAEAVVKDERYFEKVHYDHFRPMVEYCFFRGTMVMDDVLVLEDIDRGVQRIRSRTGLSRLPWENRASYHPRAHHTAPNVDRVYRLYEADKNFHDDLFARARAAPSLASGWGRSTRPCWQ